MIQQERHEDDELQSLHQLIQQDPRLRRDLILRRPDFFVFHYVAPFFADFHLELIRTVLNHRRAVLLAPRHAMKCIPAFSVLRSSIGINLYPEEVDLQAELDSRRLPGESLLTSKNRVISCCGPSMKRVVRLLTSSGFSLDASPDHKVFVLERDSRRVVEKPISEIRLNYDFLLRCKPQMCVSSVSEVIPRGALSSHTHFRALVFALGFAPEYEQLSEEVRSLFSSKSEYKVFQGAFEASAQSLSWFKIPYYIRQRGDLAVDNFVYHVLLLVLKSGIRLPHEYLIRDLLPRIFKFRDSLSSRTLKLVSVLVSGFCDSKGFKGVDERAIAFASVIGARLDSTLYNKLPPLTRRLLDRYAEVENVLIPVELEGMEAEAVVDVFDLGLQPCFDFETTLRRFVADSFLVHNSTVVTVGMGLWYALRDPTLRIAIVSRTLSGSMRLLRRIRKICERPDLVEAFPDVIPHPITKAEKWSDMEILFKRDAIWAEATFTALSVGDAITGGHFDIIFFDDLVTMKDARSEVERKKLWDWFRMSAIPSLDQFRESRIYVVGTKYHPDDLYGQLERLHRSGKTTWEKILKIPAIKPDGTSFWPEEYPIEKLQQIQEELGPIVFALQYQQEDVQLVDEELAIVVTRSDIERVYVDEINVETTNVVAVDPAGVGKSSKSKFAVVVVGVDSGGLLYLLETFAQPRVTLSRQKEIVEQFARRHNALIVVLETVAYQTVLPLWMSEEGGIPCLIKGVSPTQSKTVKFEVVAKLLLEGKLLLKRGVVDHFVDEMLKFPATTADVIDATFYAVQEAKRAVQPSVRFL